MNDNIGMMKGANNNDIKNMLFYPYGKASHQGAFPPNQA